MGGYAQFPEGESLGLPPDLAGNMRRRGLLPALLNIGLQGEQWDRNAGQGQPLNTGAENRIEDTTTRHPMGEVAPMVQGAEPRQSDDHLARLQAQYEGLAEPQPKPLSLKQKILRSALTLAPVALGGIFGGSEGAEGAGEGVQATLAQQMKREQFQQQQRTAERGRLLEQIEAERRMQEQERMGTERMTMQQQMEAQRERERQAGQERLFGQQNQLETMREKARQEATAQTQAAAEERQARQFAEQEKLALMRQQGGAASDRSYQFHSKRIDSIRNPIEQRAERISRLEDTLAQGTPQADALIAPELLTVMAGGQGSGLRMNEAEIARVIGGRTQWETLKAKLYAWQADPNKGFALTPAQRQQTRALFTTIKQRVAQKMQVIDEESDRLANSNDPQQHRMIYNRLQKRLSAIDTGGGGGQVQVRDPRGVMHTFPDQQSADAFKKAAGIQ